MCLSPIRVPNKKSTKDFNRFVDRVYNTVPCNKCEECLSQLTSAFESRAIAEFQYTKNIGGQTYFYTLTYNENEVPKYKDVMCFCGRDLTRFYKLLRMRLDNHHIKLKSFVSSEYGENGTQRPHYHMLLHLSKPIDGKLLRKYISESWVRFKGRGRFQKSFSLGYNKPGTIKDQLSTKYGLVLDVRPCKYVAKYVAKDINQISHFLNTKLTNTIIEQSKEDDIFQKQKYSFLPIHRASIGYGISLTDYIQDYEYINGKFNFALDRKKDGSFVEHTIPLYIKRKKMYGICSNFNKNIVYRLNDFGIKIKKLQIQSQIKDCIQKYIDLESKIDTFDFSPFNLSCDYVKALFNSVDPNELFIYIYLKRGSLFNSFYNYNDVPFFLNQYYEFYKFPERYNLIHSSFELKEELFDFVYCVYLYMLSNLKFKAYVKNKECYNQEQYYKSLESGKFKPLYIKSFREYLDFTKILLNNLPLLTRFKRVKEKIKVYNSLLEESTKKIFNDLKQWIKNNSIPPWLLGENDLSKTIIDVCPF